MKKSFELDLYLNLLVQSPNKDSEKWFTSLYEEDQRFVISRLAYICNQFGLVSNDLQSLLAGLPKKLKGDAFVQLSNCLKEEPLGGRLLSGRLTLFKNLHSNQLLKAYLILVEIGRKGFSMLRAQGLQPENKWWHKDLLDESVLNDLKKNPPY